jgi:membrane-associated protein
MPDWSELIRPLLEHGIYFWTIAILILCGMGLPIPEEILFLTVGYVGSSQNVVIHGYLWDVQHGVSVEALCVAGVVGILIGDSIPFFLGRRYGLSLIQRPFFARLITPKRIDATRLFFQNHGAKAVFMARFVAGLRMPTFFMTGAMGVKYPRFVFWDTLGALISCPTSIWLSYKFGPEAVDLLGRYKIVLFAVIGALAIYLGYRLWKQIAEATARAEAAKSQTRLTPPPEAKEEEPKKKEEEPKK